MFDELKIRTVHVDGEDYVNILDLANHLTFAMLAMADEIKDAKENGELNPMDYNFSVGMVHGMREISLLLAQGGIEIRMDREVETLDDLMNFG